MSTEPTTKMMNEVIARFMGYEKVTVGYSGTDEETEWQRSNEQWMDKVRLVMVGNYFVNVSEDKWFECEYIKYHSSWEWLMPVVEKIESIYDSFHGYFGVHISSNSCCVQGTKLDTRPGKEHYAYFNEVVHETKIRAAHYAVYQFITWFNQQKQTNDKKQ